MISKEKHADRYLDKATKAVLGMFILVVLLLLAFYGIDWYRSYTFSPVVNRVITLLEERVRKNPRDLDLRIVLGEAYLKNGQTDEAITQFKQVVKVDSSREDAYVDLGIAYMKKNMFVKAEDQFKTVIAMNELSQYKLMNKRLESAHYYMAASQFRRHQYRDALMNVRKALKIGPTNSDTFLLLGRIYLDKKQYKQAVSCFTKSIRFDPKFADAYYGRGLAYEKMNLKDKALSDYSRALREFPDFSEAKEALQKLRQR